MSPPLIPPLSGMRAGGGNLGRPFFLLLAFLPFCSLKYSYFIVFLNVCQTTPVGQDRRKTTDEAKRRGKNTGVTEPMDCRSERGGNQAWAAG
jgi:hypothetical protein